MRLHNALVGAFVLFTACSSEVPGEGPPRDKLLYPVGIAYAPGATAAEDRVLVGSTNFDQRYNAGLLTALDASALFEQASTGTTASPRLISTLPVTSAVRVLSFSGELFMATTAGGTRVYTGHRGFNRLTAAELEAGELRCRTPGVDTLPALDCSQAYVVHTSGNDPYALALAAGLGVQGQLAVGHLNLSSADSGEVGRVTLLDLDEFDQRIANEGPGETAYVAPVVAVDLPSFSGVGAVIPTSETTLLVAGGRRRVDTSLLDIRQFDLAQAEARPDLVETASLSLRDGAIADEIRGAVRDGDRLYVSIRFVGSVVNFNSAIAVVALDAGGPRLVSVFEVGEELGRPALLKQNGQRRLYVPDFRRHELYVVDVTGDVPFFVHRFRGRLDVDGVRVGMLDGPTEIVFAERDAKTYGFVTNFRNSTLAVLDATHADPRQQALIARFGAAVLPDGTVEGEDE